MSVAAPSAHCEPARQRIRRHAFPRGFRLARPVQANELFVLLPASLVDALQNRGHQPKAMDARGLGRDAGKLLHVVRFVTTWNTSMQDVLEAMALVAN
jgi:threonine aldolase